MVVEGGNEVGLDPAVEQRLERGLGGDDDDLVAHVRVGEQVDVLGQARAGCHTHGGVPGGGFVEGVGALAGGVVGQVQREVAAGARGVDERGDDVGTAESQDVGDELAELIELVGVELAGWGVGDEDGALGEHGGEAVESAEQGGAVDVGLDEQDVGLSEPVGVIDGLEHATQQGEVRLIDDHEAAVIES